MKFDPSIIASIIGGFNILSSVASLILSLLAIWLSLYFYTRSKDSEKNVEINLHEIKMQTESLEKLTSKWMDRLTKYVTSPQPTDETTTKLLELVTVSFTGLSKQVENPSGDETKKQLVSYITTTLIAIFYYVGLANISLQGYLPVSELDADPNLKNLIDSSYNDYISVKSSLLSVNTQDLSVNPLYSLYQQALQMEQLVKTAVRVYAERVAV